MTKADLSSGAGSQRWGAMLFIVIGLCALTFAGWQAFQTLSFLHSAVAVQGLVAPDTPDSTSVKTAGHPTITFKTADGRNISYQQDGMGPTRVGSTVKVLYRPADPVGTARASSFLAVWQAVVWPAVMGLGFIALPLLGFEIGVRGR